MAEAPDAVAIAVRAALILQAWLACYRTSRGVPLAGLATCCFAPPLFVARAFAPILRE